MLYALWRRCNATSLFTSGSLSISVSCRHLSVNSGIASGLRAEKRSKPWEGRGRNRPTPGRYGDVNKRGKPLLDRISSEEGHPPRNTRRSEFKPDRRRAEATSGSEEALTAAVRIEARFRSGRKPGKWERAALAAGGSRDDWRDVRAVRRPGKGPTYRRSDPGKIWDRFRKEDEDETDTFEAPKPQVDRKHRSWPKKLVPEEENEAFLEVREDAQTSEDSAERRDRRRPVVEAETCSETRKLDIPDRIPVTSATSELIFGRNSVVSVLRSKRRKFFKLYVHERVYSDIKKGEELFWELGRMASEAGVEIKQVDDDWLPRFDRTSQGKAHNGVVLEASRVPTPLLMALDKCGSDENGPFISVKLDRNDEPSAMRVRRATTAKVRYPASADGKHPLIIYCHNLTDSGNFGAVLRSAYWFKAAGVAFPLRASAKPDAVTVKTSSGASEGVNLFSVRDTTAFLTQTRKAGWELVAAMPPTNRTKFGNLHARSEYNIPDERPRLAELRRRAPVLLMLGGEEHGIPFSIAQIATGKVSISGRGLGGDEDRLGVDSLNVSVAGSLILAEFARPLDRAAESAASEEQPDESSTDNNGDNMPADGAERQVKDVDDSITEAPNRIF